MFAVGEDELICDLAETYRIYDYEQLPPQKVAAFAVGLRDDSRIKMKLSGMKVPANTLFLAQIADAANTLIWMNSKDNKNPSKRPKSLVEALTEPKKDEKPLKFSNGSEFDNFRKELLRKRGHTS
jgi:hypothetical protein